MSYSKLFMVSHELGSKRHFSIISTGHPICCETYCSFLGTPCASPASCWPPWLSKEHFCWKIWETWQFTGGLSNSLENLGSELLNLPRPFSWIVNFIQSGLLPILKWLISLERSPPATRNLLTIERLQGWCMLAYYPLEHIYYLGSHGIIPTVITSPFSLFTSKKKKLSLDLNTIGLWSCRFWAVYIVLHFAHLLEDRQLLKQRYNSLRKAKGTGLTPAEKLELRQRWDVFWSEVVINLGYLPLTIHW